MPDNNISQYKVIINGSELPTEASVDVMSVTVSQYTQGADMFTLEVNNWNSDRQEYKWIDTDQYAVGREVEIKMGYVDNIKSLIKGEITALEPEFHSDRAPTVKVQGYDRLHRFRRGRKTRSFIEKKDSQVAEQIARELQLQSQVEDTRIVHPYLLQHNQADIDFLQERARRIRYEVDVENRTLIFRPVANNRGKAVTLAFKDKLKTFYPRMTTMDQVSEVVVQGWNPKTKEAIIGRAKAGDETGKMGGAKTGPVLTDGAFGTTKTVVVDRYLFNQAEAEQIAKARYNEIALDFITGEGTAIGNPDLKAGEVTEITRLGQRFSGHYYITAACHVINQKGYLTHLCVQRNAL